MEEWQNQTQDPEPPLSMRGRFALMFAEAIEQAEEKYLMGTLSAEDYQAELRDIDAKLSVIGLTLLNKPWLKGANRV
jgi:hypothetical protein